MCLNSSERHLSRPKGQLQFQVYPKFSLPPNSTCVSSPAKLDPSLTLFAINSQYITHFPPWLAEKGKHYAFPTKSYLSEHYHTINRAVILQSTSSWVHKLCIVGQMLPAHTFISFLKLKTNLVNLTQVRVKSCFMVSLKLEILPIFRIQVAPFLGPGPKPNRGKAKEVKKQKKKIPTRSLFNNLQHLPKSYDIQILTPKENSINVIKIFR